MTLFSTPDGIFWFAVSLVGALGTFILGLLLGLGIRTVAKFLAGFAVVVVVGVVALGYLGVL